MKSKTANNFNINWQKDHKIKGILNVTSKNFSKESLPQNETFGVCSEMQLEDTIGSTINSPIVKYNFWKRQVENKLSESGSGNMN